MPHLVGVPRVLFELVEPLDVYLGQLVGGKFVLYDVRVVKNQPPHTPHKRVNPLHLQIVNICIGSSQVPNALHRKEHYVVFHEIHQGLEAVTSSLCFEHLKRF